MQAFKNKIGVRVYTIFGFFSYFLKNFVIQKNALSRLAIELLRIFANANDYFG